MKKLNLNKIELYCILNNVKIRYDVPDCDNCGKKSKNQKCQIYATMFCQAEYKSFQKFSKVNDCFPFDANQEIAFRCCWKWKKKN